ncbi:hypothetical protein JW859_13710 [bacterium]|nr:hypothetical protein [bacterium]
MKLNTGLIALIVALLAMIIVGSCTGVVSDSEELFTPNQAVTTDDSPNRVAPGYMSGVVPWEMEGDGVVSVAVQPEQPLVPGDGKMTMSLGTVPYLTPAQAGVLVDPEPVLFAEETYYSDNVAESQVQGMTFDPTSGDAYAFYALELESGAPYTVGLAWYSLPSAMDSYYIGIGDVQHELWHWYQGPDDGIITFDVDDWGGVIPNDDLLICVLLEDGLPADLWQVACGVPEMRGTGLAYEDPAQYVNPERETSGTKVASSLPASVDLRPYAPPVSNQGSMGSCTAFGVADAAYNIMLSQLYGEYGWDVNNDDYRSSPMWVYVKSGIAPYGSWDPPCGSSVGRYMSQPFNLLTSTGSAVEATVPYYATSNCSTTFPTQASAEAAVLRINGWYSISRTGIVDSIKEQLAVYNRPVVIAMYGLESGFLYYSGGVYHYGGTAGAAGGHAMCIVGYDDDLQAFNVRNSWGGSWGVGGYWWCGYDAAQELADLSRFSAYYMEATLDPATLEYFFDEPLPEDYDEVEPNNSIGTANALPEFDFADYSAKLDINDTVDYFSFDYAAGSSTTVTMHYSGAQLSPTLKLYDASGALLMTGVAGNGTLTLSGTWSQSGAAVVEVSNGGGSTGLYTLSGISAQPPVQPTGVSATDGTDLTGVALTWNPCEGTQTYTIQRADSPNGQYANIGGSYEPAFVDYEVELWQEYWYRVVAANDDGFSIPSAPDSGYMGIPAPDGVAATDGTGAGLVEITWSAGEAGTGYTVKRSTSPNGRWLVLGEFAAPPAIDTGAVPGTVYYYVVCCSRDGLVGPASAPDAGYIALDTGPGDVQVAQEESGDGVLEMQDDVNDPQQWTVVER